VPSATRKTTGARSKARTARKPKATPKVVASSQAGAPARGRGKELSLLAAMFAMAFALVALADWRAADPTWWTKDASGAENLCGPVGAVVADLLYTALGFGAWAMLVPFGAAGLKIAGRPLMSVWRWLALVASFVAALGLLEVALPGRAPHRAGGAVGELLAVSLQATVGAFGTVLVLLALLTAAVTLVARIRWRVVFAWLVDRMEALWPHVRGGAAAGAGLAGRGARAAGAGVLAVGSAGAQGVARGARSAGGRMVQSLRRRSADDPLLPEPEQELDAIEDEGAPSSVPPSEIDEEGPPTATQVAVLAPQLAEVQWDSTSADGAGLRASTSPSSAAVLGMFPELEPRSVRTRASDPDPTSPIAAPVDDPSVVEGGLAPRVVEVELDDEPDAVVVPAALVQPRPQPQPQPQPVLAPMRDPGRPGLVVHGAEHLNVRVRDDGGAVSDGASFAPPRLSLLDEVPVQHAVFDQEDLRRLAEGIVEKLSHFRITGQVTDVRPGPVVTIFEFQPDPGVKVSRIASLADDLAMALRAVSVRIVAPIPGKGVVGIEIPSPTRLMIFLRELLASNEFRDSERALPCVLGKDVGGKPVIADLADMPHLLVGGTTGSGKSVGVNGMLMSMLFRRTPDDLRLLLIDPKMLEFGLYDGIPHLLHPVVTEPKGAAAALAWACREMDERYALLKRWKTRNIRSYNKKVVKALEGWNRQLALDYAPDDPTDADLEPPRKLPYIVVVIDELADLMMVAKKEVETSIARLAQKARACGIHLIVATQRPSVDVITGVIKANLPTRLSFQLRTGTDSRTVLGTGGAESLLGKGDMLYLPPGTGNLMRCHGAFVSDDEVSRVMAHLRAQGEPDYIHDVTKDEASDAGEMDMDDRDDLYEAAVEIVIRSGKASTSMIQRHLKIGYNRAARIVDMMEAAGVVGPADGARPREVLLDGP
jgi:S-DNA-T family DNA segregation ATPase FtsK/SpoIIIE